MFKMSEESKGDKTDELNGTATSNLRFLISVIKNIAVEGIGT